MSGRTKLGYPFTPSPRWLLADVVAGLLSADDYLLIAVLYDRADTARLAAGLPTPSLRLETIAEWVRWTGKPESLRRQLGRLRDRGRYFTYVVDGNSRTRQRYVFTLLPDEHESLPDEPESVSAQCPPVTEPARPPVQHPETLSTSEEESVDEVGVSARPEQVERDPCPPVAAPCPPVPTTATPHGSTVSASEPSELCPPASDVQERANYSCTGTTKDQEESFLSVDLWTSFDEREKEERFSGFLAAHVESNPSGLQEQIEHARLAQERLAVRERTDEIVIEQAGDRP